MFVQYVTYHNYNERLLKLYVPNMVLHEFENNLQHCSK